MLKSCIYLSGILLLLESSIYQCIDRHNGQNFENPFKENRINWKDTNYLQSDSDTILFWSHSRKLNWDDFLNTPDLQSNYQALTFSAIEVSRSLSTPDSFVYLVRCWFVRKLSWSKDKLSTKLLAHEQLHFDITELLARKLRKEYQKFN